MFLVCWISFKMKFSYEIKQSQIFNSPWPSCRVAHTPKKRCFALLRLLLRFFLNFLCGTSSLGLDIIVSSKRQQKIFVPVKKKFCCKCGHQTRESRCSYNFFHRFCVNRIDLDVFCQLLANIWKKQSEYRNNSNFLSNFFG